MNEQRFYPLGIFCCCGDNPLTMRASTPGNVPVSPSHFDFSQKMWLFNEYWHVILRTNCRDCQTFISFEWISCDTFSRVRAGMWLVDHIFHIVRSTILIFTVLFSMALSYVRRSNGIVIHIKYSKLTWKLTKTVKILNSMNHKPQLS